MFGVAFLYSGSLWFLFIVEVPLFGWLERVACQDFLVREAWHRCFGGWSLISSLWSAMKCTVVSFEMSVGLM